MDPDQLVTLFNEALTRQSPVEREAFLARACGADAELRCQVDRLLAAHTHAGDFLKPGDLTAPDEVAGEAPGDVIGRYKLLELIGEGGFGRVYMAEQLEPVRRKVALKIIKLGMDTREVIARFEAERQALALMDHPNIARVFDAGVTGGGQRSEVRGQEANRDLSSVVCPPSSGSGRPYFVMELVPGIPITDYCDQQQLPTADRLKLFVKVCHAVQHAHQKGVIHRDLKPSNILVTLHDGEPMPKVIDFGVAKAIGQPLTDKTLFTRFARMIGTPAYMSPEQAALSGLDVDTRSDIYSLGVLLYELLTGTTPLQRETLRQAALDEIQRMIRETDPPKPSTRLMETGRGQRAEGRGQRPEARGQRAEDGDQRSAVRGLRGKEVRGDLDWIVMKALEKDRQRRYETANAFALDLERHLHHEPVEAGPPTAAYRLGKFVRRHRTGVLAGSVVSVAITVGLVAALIGFLEARQERDRARAAEQRAEDEASTARLAVDMTRAVNSFLLDDLLGQASPGRNPDRNLTLRAALDRAAEKVGDRFKTNAALEAAIRGTLGNTYRALGEYASAEQHLRRQYDLCRQELGTNHESTIHAQIYLAEALIEQARSNSDIAAEVESMLKEVLETSRRTLGPQHGDTLSILNNLARLCFETNRDIEGLQLCEQVLELRRQTQTTDEGQDHQIRSLLASAYVNLGRPADAEPILRTLLDSERRPLGPSHPNTLITLENLGCALESLGRNAEAEPIFREVVEGRRRVLGPEHPHSIIAVRSLAILHAVLAHWKPCLELEQELIRLEPANFGNWYSAAVIAQLAGETNTARELLRGMLERFGEASHPAVRFALAQDFLALPDLAPDLKPALQFAHEAFQAKSGDFAQQILKGMAEYRRGRHAEAARRLESPARHGLIQQACEAGFYLALARHASGDANGARAALDQANRLLDAVLHSGLLVSLTPGEHNRWRDYSRCAVARAEAERAILGRETSPPVTADLLTRARTTWAPVQQGLIAARQLAGQRRWNDARDAYLRALELPAFDWDTVDALDQALVIEVGTAFLRAGDAASHERLCQTWFDRLDTSGTPLAAASVAVVYLLKENGRSAELTRRAIDVAKATEESTMDYGVRFVLRLAAGLGCYRNGDWDAASPLLNEAVRADVIATFGPAEVYRALTLHRLGKTQEASEALAQTEQRLKPYLDNRIHDWRFAWNADLGTVALEEAHRALPRDGHGTEGGNHE